MSVFISDIDTAKLYVQFFRSNHLPVCSFMKALIHMLKTLSGRLQELKKEEQVQLGNPKSGRGRLRELFITKFKLQFKLGFAKVVVTRAGRLQEWSQGELRL